MKYQPTFELNICLTIKQAMTHRGRKTASVCSKNPSDKGRGPSLHTTILYDGCCYDEDGELPELLFSLLLSLINGAWKNTSQNTHDIEHDV